MNKKYQKPVLFEIKVMALEDLSAFFEEFGAFSEFNSNISTYRFVSGFKGDAVQ